MTEYAVFLQVWKCMESYCTNMVNNTGYVRVQSGNETALLDSVARIGPVRYVCMHQNQKYAALVSCIYVPMKVQNFQS